MATHFLDKGVVYKKDGTLVGRIENGKVCDEYGEGFLNLDGNEIKNNYGSVIGRVEKGGIVSPSGGILGKISEARLCFENCNNLRDVDVAAIWLPFVKGIK